MKLMTNENSHGNQSRPSARSLSITSFFTFPFDFGGEAATVESQGYCVAYGDLSGVAKDVAGGVRGDGVTAFQDAGGTALLELEAQTVEAVALGPEDVLATGG